MREREREGRREREREKEKRKREIKVYRQVEKGEAEEMKEGSETQRKGSMRRETETVTERNFNYGPKSRPIGEGTMQ